MTKKIDHRLKLSEPVAERPLAAVPPVSPQTPVGVARLLIHRQRSVAKMISPLDLIPKIRAGLDYRAFVVVAERLNLTLEQMAQTLAISPRTMARRKADERLNPQESDRLYRLTRLALRAEEVLGTTEKANEWLRRVNRALGNVAPLSLLDTDEGIRQVEAVLGRIEHGVWS